MFKKLLVMLAAVAAMAAVPSLLVAQACNTCYTCLPNKALGRDEAPEILWLDGGCTTGDCGNAIECPNEEEQDDLQLLVDAADVDGLLLALENGSRHVDFVPERSALAVFTSCSRTALTALVSVPQTQVARAIVADMIPKRDLAESARIATVLDSPIQ